MLPAEESCWILKLEGEGVFGFFFRRRLESQVKEDIMALERLAFELELNGRGVNVVGMSMSLSIGVGVRAVLMPPTAPVAGVEG